jgi:hypothetical protein
MSMTTTEATPATAKKSEEQHPYKELYSKNRRKALDLDKIFAEPVRSDVQAPPSSQEAVPWPTSLSGPAPCEMRIRGDGTGVEIKQWLHK